MRTLFFVLATLLFSTLASLAECPNAKGFASCVNKELGAPNNVEVLDRVVDVNNVKLKEAQGMCEYLCSVNPSYFAKEHGGTIDGKPPEETGSTITERPRKK